MAITASSSSSASSKIFFKEILGIGSIMTSDDKNWINDDDGDIPSRGVALEGKAFSSWSLEELLFSRRAKRQGVIPYQELSGIASIAKDFIPPNDVLPYISVKRFVNVSKSDIYFFLWDALNSVGISTSDPQYDLDHPMPCTQIGVLDDVKIFYARIASMINNSHFEFPDFFNEFFRILTQCIENRLVDQLQEWITPIYFINPFPSADRDEPFGT